MAYVANTHNGANKNVSLYLFSLKRQQTKDKNIRVGRDRENIIMQLLLLRLKLSVLKFEIIIIIFFCEENSNQKLWRSNIT